MNTLCRKLKNFKQALIISAELAELTTWPQILALKGQIFRTQPGRRTLRFVVNETAYFAKIHTGIGWLEIFKNLGQGRYPVLGAKEEWQAIKSLQDLGIPTMTLVGYGRRGYNPAKQQSFVITQEITNTISLEDYCAQWRDQPPKFAEKLAILREVAAISRQLHQHGLNHRDYYLCHFLLDRASIGLSPKLFLIDLHRVQQRKKIPIRWLVKDLAGLYFSSLDIGLTSRDIWRFLKIYCQQPLRKIIKLPWLSAIHTRALSLYSKTWQRYPVLLQHFATAREQANHPLLNQITNRRTAFWCVKKQALATMPSLASFLQEPANWLKNHEKIYLKAGDSTTVMQTKLDGVSVVIKRYNLLNWLHQLKRLVSPSRAWRCWQNAHILMRFKIATPLPVAYYEERWLWVLRRRAYFVMSAAAGENVADIFNSVPIHPDKQKACTLGMALLAQFARHKIGFGDMKATNFLLQQGQVIVLDLDGMRVYRCHYLLKRQQQRDSARWNRNFT